MKNFVSMEDPPPYEEVSHCRVCNCTFTTFKRRVRFFCLLMGKAGVGLELDLCWYLGFLNFSFKYMERSYAALVSAFAKFFVVTSGWTATHSLILCYAASLSCLWEKPV